MITVAGVAIIIIALYGVRCAVRCTLDPLLWVGELRLRESAQHVGGTLLVAAANEHAQGADPALLPHRAPSVTPHLGCSSGGSGGRKTPGIAHFTPRRVCMTGVFITCNHPSHAQNPPPLAIQDGILLAIQS